MKVKSKLNPRIHGHIIRWLDSNHFIMVRRGTEILGHKDYWEFEE